MKITEVRTFITWGEPRNWVFVKIITDTGLCGKDPLPVEEHWQVLYRHGFWRGGVVLTSALAGLDQALWDLRGKAWGVPVYQLLGGPTRKRIRLYTHVGIYNPDLLEEDARRDIADGFTAVKTGARASEASPPGAGPSPPL